jgi:hypothetical protein
VFAGVLLEGMRVKDLDEIITHSEEKEREENTKVTSGA